MNPNRAIGPAEYNLTLSRHRADSVAVYLMDSYGVDPDQIMVKWYGETKPVSAGIQKALNDCESSVLNQPLRGDGLIYEKAETRLERMGRAHDSPSFSHVNEPAP